MPSGKKFGMALATMRIVEKCIAKWNTQDDSLSLTYQKLVKR